MTRTQKTKKTQNKTQTKIKETTRKAKAAIMDSDSKISLAKKNEFRAAARKAVKEYADVLKELKKF